MRRIVMAAKAGREQPWLADAAAELAQQMGGEVLVVSVDGLELEALSPTPRDEFVALARESIDQAVARLHAAGVSAEGVVRSGTVVRGILLYAEEVNADLIVCGASTKGPMARRILGSVPIELISRSRRPVIVITPPSG